MKFHQKTVNKIERRNKTFEFRFWLHKIGRIGIWRIFQQRAENITLVLYRTYNGESSQNHMYRTIISQLVIACCIRCWIYLCCTLLPKSFSIVTFDPVYPIFMRHWKPLSRMNREKLHKRLGALNSWISISFTE